MLPSENAVYSRHEYWDERYKTEERYEWFQSVYESCVDTIFQQLEKVYNGQLFHKVRKGAGEAIFVLHLGTGNSSLVYDLYQKYVKKYTPALETKKGEPSEKVVSIDKGGISRPPYRLVQVAVDYSETVIRKMKERYPPTRNEVNLISSLNGGTSPSTDDVVEVPDEMCTAPSFDVCWRVADVRDLSAIREEFSGGFDLIIDKGTMDALEVETKAEEKENNIASMLHEVSACFKPSRGAYTQFIQVTWEVPLYRLYYTLNKDENYPYAWKSNESHSFIGESDIYRIFIYEVNPLSSTCC